jgi:hypothetical protein
MRIPSLLIIITIITIPILILPHGRGAGVGKRFVSLVGDDMCFLPLLRVFPSLSFPTSLCIVCVVRVFRTGGSVLDSLGGLLILGGLVALEDLLALVQLVCAWRRRVSWLESVHVHALFSSWN